jgi:hypothetical protein
LPFAGAKHGFWCNSSELTDLCVAEIERGQHAVSPYFRLSPIWQNMPVEVLRGRTALLLTDFAVTNPLVRMGPSEAAAAAIMSLGC